MAISFDQAGAWSAVGGTTPYTVTRPTLVAGDVGVVRMYCIAVFRDFSVTATCTSNAGADAWTQIAQFADGTTAPGEGTGSVKVAIWYRDFPGTGDSNPSVALSGAATRTGCVLTFRKGASDTWDTPGALTAAITNWTTSSQVVTSSGTATIPYSSVIFAAAALRNASAAMTRPSDGIGDDGSPALTYNGNYVEAPATHQSSTTGNNLAADAGYRLVTAGAAGVNLTQTATISSAETGASVWVYQGLVPETHSGTAHFAGGGIITEAGRKAGTGHLVASGGGLLTEAEHTGRTAAAILTGGGILTEADTTDRTADAVLTGGGILTAAGVSAVVDTNPLPTVALAEHLSTVLPSEWSVLQGPAASVEPLAVVLRTDTPWISPYTFAYEVQRYAAIAAVPAASPGDGEQDLHEVIFELMNNLPEGWRFVSSNGMTLDQSTGMPLLTAKMSLEYASTETETG